MWAGNEVPQGRLRCCRRLSSEHFFRLALRAACSRTPGKWDRLGHGRAEMRMGSGRPATEGTPGLESLLKLRLMALLTDLVRAHGSIGARGLLGVSLKTVWRARSSGTLPSSLLAALERWVREDDDGEVAGHKESARALGSRVAEL